MLSQALLDGLLDAVLLVEPVGLRVMAANPAAAALLGIDRPALLGRPVIEFAATPEDQFFWEDVAAGMTLAAGPPLHSDSQVRHADGRLLPVERRVERIWMQPDRSVFVLALRDQRPQRRSEDELERLLAELRATLESTADGILATDLQGAIRGCNGRFAELWSVPADLMTRRDDAAVVAWMRSQVADIAAFDRRLCSQRSQPLARLSDRLRLRSGRVLECVSLPQYARGRPVGRVCSFRDITEQLAAAERLQLAGQVFASSLDAIFVTDAEHRIVEANPACERLAGQPRAALLGRAMDALLCAPDDPDWFAVVGARLADAGVWEGELCQQRADGSPLPGHVSLVRLPAGADGQVRHVGFFKDLSETLAAQRRIEELAYRDALTGLPNRALLAERVEFAQALAQRHGQPFALLFLDLDRFKQINDSLGHDFGDRVLVDVAGRLSACVRGIDTVARLGGDEFVLLLQHTDARGAEVIARRVLALMAEPFVQGAMKFSLTASIGIALYPNDGDSLDALVKNADAAMYRVKQRGRAGFRFYQPQMNVDLLARMKLDHAMRMALDRGDFRLHFQPQVEIASGMVVGAEALLRWCDPELGNVSPAEFIPVAEESGFIVALGNWVLAAAVRQAAEWQRRGLEIAVAVNVSALQFQQADFVERVAEALASAGLPAARLELELTESILIQDADEALQRLSALARLGVRLAIDDFGTGYSSLAYLKRFPIRKLKIDRSFVKGLPGDDSDAGIAQAIVQVARALKLQVIAEGVETAEQLDFLLRAGCDDYQGFLFAPALPPEQFEATLRAGLAAALESDTTV